MLVDKLRYFAIMFIENRTYVLLIKAPLNVDIIPIFVPKNSKNYNRELLKKILLEYAIQSCMYRLICFNVWTTIIHIVRTQFRNKGVLPKVVLLSTFCGRVCWQ